MRKFLLSSFALLMSVAMMAVGAGDGTNKANAIDFDWTSGNIHEAPGALWYCVDLAPINAAAEPALVLYLTNLSDEEAAVDVQISLAGTQRTVSYNIAAEGYYRMDLPIAQFREFITVDQVNLALQSNQKIALSAKVYEFPEYVKEAVANSEPIDWNSGVKQDALSTKWYEVDITSLKTEKQHLQVGFINHEASKKALLTATFVLRGENITLPLVVPAGFSTTKVIDYQLLAKLPVNRVHVGVTTDSPIEVVTSTKSAIATDPTPCLNAIELQHGKEYVHEAGAKQWYKISLDLLKSEADFSSFYLANKSGKRAHVTLGLVPDCQYTTGTKVTLPIPAGFELGALAPNILDNLIKELQRFETTYNKVDAKDVFLEIVTDQPIHFGLDINNAITNPCLREDLVTFDWETGAKIEAGKATWFDMELDAVRNLGSHINFTFTNHADSIVWVATVVSVDCPAKVTMPLLVPVPARASVDQLVDYSILDAINIDNIYVGVKADGPVELKATAVNAEVIPSAGCESATLLGSGEYTQNPGTKWYQLPMSLFDEVGAAAKLSFKNLTGSTATLSAGVTVGCEYAIAHRAKVKVPKSIDLSVNVPKRILNFARQFVDNDVESFYLQLTTDKAIKFSIDLQAPDVDACRDAVEFDWAAWEKNGLQLQANQDIWYSVKLDYLFNKLEKGDDLVINLVNGSEDMDVNVLATVSPTCPALLSVEKTVNIPAGSDLYKVFTYEEVMKYVGQYDKYIYDGELELLYGQLATYKVYNKIVEVLERYEYAKFIPFGQIDLLLEAYGDHLTVAGLKDLAHNYKKYLSVDQLKEILKTQKEYVSLQDAITLIEKYGDYIPYVDAESILKKYEKYLPYAGGVVPLLKKCEKYITDENMKQLYDRCKKYLPIEEMKQLIDRLKQYMPANNTCYVNIKTTGELIVKPDDPEPPTPEEPCCPEECADVEVLDYNGEIVLSQLKLNQLYKLDITSLYDTKYESLELTIINDVHSDTVIISSEIYNHCNDATPIAKHQNKVAAGEDWPGIARDKFIALAELLDITAQCCMFVKFTAFDTIPVTPDTPIVPPTPECEDIVTDTIICAGDTFVWSVNGKEYKYTETTNVEVPAQTTDGCKFNYILDLTVINGDTIMPTDSVEICKGDSLEWRGQTYTEANTYTDTEDVKCGTITYNLVLSYKDDCDTPDDPCANVKDSITNVEICEGETYVWEVNGKPYGALGAATEASTAFNADADHGTASTTAGAYQVSKDGITLDVTQGRLQNAEGGHYRIYANNTLTITSTVGKITKVEFTCTANNTNQYGPGCFNVADGTYSYNDKVGVWTGSADEVVFTANRQVRATDIVVTYGGGAATSGTDEVVKPNEDGCDVKYILNWKVIECPTPEDPCADAELISWTDVVNIPATSGKWYKIDVRTAVESGKDIKFTVINGDEPNKVNVKFNTECFIVPDEPVDEPVEPANTITVRAKVPDTWTDQIYVWVWPDNGEGAEYVAEKDGDWWSYTHEGEYVNIIFKNGIGWNGPDYQTIDMRFTSDACLQLGSYAWDSQFGENRISYVEVPCDPSAKVAPYEIADEYNEFNSLFAANETKSTIITTELIEAFNIKDYVYAYVTTTGSATAYAELVEDGPIIPGDDCEHATLLDWRNGVYLSQLSAGWYKLDVKDVHANQESVTAKVINDLTCKATVTAAAYAHCEDEDALSEGSKTFKLGESTKTVSYADFSDVVAPHLEYVYVNIISIVEDCKPIEPGEDCEHAILLDWSDVKLSQLVEGNWYKLDFSEVHANQLNPTFKATNDLNGDASVSAVAYYHCEDTEAMGDATKKLVQGHVGEREVSYKELTDMIGQAEVLYVQVTDITVTIVDPCADIPEIDWTKGIKLSQLQEGAMYKLNVASVHEGKADVMVSVDNDLTCKTRVAASAYYDCQDDETFFEGAYAFELGAKEYVVKYDEFQDYVAEYIEYVYVQVDKIECAEKDTVDVAEFVCDGTEYVDALGEKHIISSLLDPALLTWTAETTDSVYNYVITPIVAPAEMTAELLATIPGAMPVLVAGEKVDVTGTVEAIKNYYDAQDTEAVADVETVVWTAGADATLACEDKSHTMLLTVTSGCEFEWTVELTLDVTPVEPVELTETACDSYEWHGETYTVSGDYTYEDGCYKEILHLTINKTEVVELTETACESYEWRGETYTESGDYTYDGDCYKEILHLTINGTEVVELTETACESYEWHGETYTESGDYTYEAECYKEILHLTINKTVYEDITVTECYSYTWYGETYVRDTVVSVTVAGDNGCDRVETLHLTITAETPEANPAFSNVVAVPKYGNRMIVLHLNDFAKDNGWTPANGQVEWYQVVGEMDNSWEIVDDQPLGSGMYIENLNGFTGEIYAIIDASNGGACGSLYRTAKITLDPVAQAPKLMPTIARPSEDLHLMNLNPSNVTEVRVFNTSGELMATYQAEEASEFVFKAATLPGYYMVEVQHNGEQTTLRYIVK